MAPTLYHVPRTISSPIVQILLELDVVDKPVVVKELSFADLKSKEHLAINPMGTSPAFRDDDLHVTMWESGAVLDYLLERYDSQNQFWPASTDESSTPEQIMARCKFLQLKQYIIATVYPFIASMYIHSLKKDADQDKEYMEAAKKKCHTVLGPVMTRWLGDGPYFLGDQVSAVDFLAAKPFSNVKSLGLLSEFPSLESLYNAVSSRPSYKMAYESMKTNKSSPPNDQSIVLVPKKEDCSTSSKKRTWSLKRLTA